MTIRIAMWSGPRNISTAMLRSWGSRADSYVTDEPLYSHYLDQTEVDHPGRDEVIAHHERDWQKVVAWLTGPVPEGRAIWYQKHMAHHLLPQIDRSVAGWLSGLTHAFLIREPREMLTSLAKVTPNPKLADTGLPQQLELFEQVRERLGTVPPVVDSKDVLQDPRRALGRLCEVLSVPWDEAMLAHAGAGSPFRDVTRFAQNPEALSSVSTASLSRWHRDLDERDRRIFKRIAGPLLVELGYAADDGW